MHTYILTRGIKHQVDQFITELQGKYLSFKWRDPKETDNKLVDTFVQVSVRPIQLWEIVYPEEHKDLVLATLFPDGKGGKTQHKKHEKFIWGLRKGLGVTEVPPYNKERFMPINKEGVEIIGIGNKTDYWVTEDGRHVDKKEEGAFEGL